MSFIPPVGSNRPFLKRTAIALAAVLAFAAVTHLSSCAQATPAPADDDKGFEQKLGGSDIKFKMVPIPAGTFTMGSASGKPEEQPAHEVKVDAFFMEEHEVTWDEYNAFLSNYNRLAKNGLVPIPQDKMADAVTYPTPMYDMEAGPALQRMGGRSAGFPAVIMSQYAARQYTKWLSKKTGRFYRLPSETEWEYAARAGTKTAYFFGDDASKLGDYAWFKGNSNEADGDTGYHKIMTKKPNPWGLYDMYGNAAEWCVDQFAADWYKQFAGKTTDAAATVNFAQDAKSAYPRVLRGGSYDSEADECRSASRLPSNKLMNNTDPQLPKSPHWMSDGFFIGFRVVSPVKTPTDAEMQKWWTYDDKITAKTLDRDRERREVPQQGPLEK